MFTNLHKPSYSYIEDNRLFRRIKSLLSKIRSLFRRINSSFRRIKSSFRRINSSFRKFSYATQIRKHDEKL